MLDTGASSRSVVLTTRCCRSSHGEPDEPADPIHDDVQTVCARGNLTKGIEFGVEIAQQVEKIVGTPCCSPPA